MKVRHGFVSNSSSSSFVVLVNEMTTEQQHEFARRVESIDWDEVAGEYGEPRFSRSGKVFGGECDYSACDAVYQVLKSMHLENLMEDLGP